MRVFPPKAETELDGAGFARVPGNGNSCNAVLIDSRTKYRKSLYKTTKEGFMKKLLLATAMVLLLASFVYAADTSLDVHNFNITYSGQTSATGQGCRGCHIPHGGSIIDSVNPSRTTVFGSGVADPSTGVYKLWDKNLSSFSGQTYSSDNVTGELLSAPTTSTDVAWHTYLCFSCHDGAAASLNLQPTTFGDPYDYLVNVTLGGVLDSDLTNDHPVDIAWPLADAGVGLDYDTVVNVTGAASAGTGTIWVNGSNAFYPNVQHMPLYGATAKVECATCHNPHLQVQSITIGGGTHGNFLRMSTLANNTDLCRTCHLSKR